jgi:hypothetical protein
MLYPKIAINIFSISFKKELSYFNIKSGAREKNQGWRLNYFVTSQYLHESIIDSEVFQEHYCSDHVPLCLFLDEASLKEISQSIAGQSNKHIPFTSN